MKCIKFVPFKKKNEMFKTTNREMTIICEIHITFMKDDA